MVGFWGKAKSQIYLFFEPCLGAGGPRLLVLHGARPSSAPTEGLRGTVLGFSPFAGGAVAVRGGKPTLETPLLLPSSWPKRWEWSRGLNE